MSFSPSPLGWFSPNKSVRVNVPELCATPTETSRKPSAFFVDSIGSCRLELFAVGAEISLLRPRSWVDPHSPYQNSGRTLVVPHEALAPVVFPRLFPSLTGRHGSIPPLLAILFSIPG